MLRFLPVALTGGVAASVFSMAEALYALQQGPAVIGRDVAITTETVVQITILMGSGAMLLLAGRIIGKWEAAQKAWMDKVNDGELKLRELEKEIALVRGNVAMLETRTRAFAKPKQEGAA